MKKSSLLFYGICLILIFVGAVSAIKLANLFDIQSGEYGSVVLYTKYTENEVFSKLDNFNFQMDDDTLGYTSITTYEPQKFNGEIYKYDLCFNNQPVNHVVQTAGRISGDLHMKFKNTDGTIASVAEINIVVEYLAKETRVTITVPRFNNSMSYLQSYININDAVLRVLLKEAK